MAVTRRVVAILLVLASAGCDGQGRVDFDRRHAKGDELRVVDSLVTALTPGIRRTLGPRGRAPDPGLCVARTLGGSALDLADAGRESKLLRLLGRRGPFASLRLAAKPALELGEADINRHILNAVDSARCTEVRQVSLRRVHFYEDKAIVRFESGGCPISSGYFLLAQPEARGAWQLIATVATNGPCPFSLEPPSDPGAWFHARGAL